MHNSYIKIFANFGTKPKVQEPIELRRYNYYMSICLPSRSDFDVFALNRTWTSECMGKYFTTLYTI